MTVRRFSESNLAGLFLFSQRVEGLTVEVSPCCGLGAKEGVEIETVEVGTDGPEDLALDLRAGGGASCCLKLAISEENKQTKLV